MTENALELFYLGSLNFSFSFHRHTNATDPEGKLLKALERIQSETFGQTWSCRTMTRMRALTIKAGKKWTFEGGCETQGRFRSSVLHYIFSVCSREYSSTLSSVLQLNRWITVKRFNQWQPNTTRTPNELWQPNGRKHYYDLGLQTRGLKTQISVSVIAPGSVLDTRPSTTK